MTSSGKKAAKARPAKRLFRMFLTRQEVEDAILACAEKKVQGLKLNGASVSLLGRAFREPRDASDVCVCIEIRRTA